jgi:hypothetical protein
MNDDRLAKIESEVQQFVEPRILRWLSAPSAGRVTHLASRCSSSMRGSQVCIPLRDITNLVHLIPDEYYRSNLADSVWFELTPGEDPESVSTPRSN